MTKYEKYKLLLKSLLGLGFIAVLYNFSENNRYRFHDQEKRAIIDSRTGTVYWLPGYVKYDLKEFKKETKKKATD